MSIFEIYKEDVACAGQWDGPRVDAIDFSDHLALWFDNPEQCKALADRLSRFADMIAENVKSETTK